MTHRTLLYVYPKDFHLIFMSWDDFFELINEKKYSWSTVLHSRSSTEAWPKKSSVDSSLSNSWMNSSCTAVIVCSEFKWFAHLFGYTGHKFNRRYKVRVQVVLNNFSATELCKVLAALPHNAAKYDSVPATKWTSRFSGIKGRGKRGGREGTGRF